MRAFLVDCLQDCPRQELTARTKALEQDKPVLNSMRKRESDRDWVLTLTEVV